ncbi:hypothetical protein CK203_033186 [Vitis vinifera]|uniref:Uncharacterized protein n=1 Tax=Vitis vinifera TaxID=29760 RepID=A0A438G051_VITVI|nr:hypothetical protein CK203_033186 [Vitis vinifera]
MSSGVYPSSFTDLHETADDLSHTLPMGIVHSSGNLDDQETLVELANASETEMDIPVDISEKMIIVDMNVGILFVELGDML